VPGWLLPHEGLIKSLPPAQTGLCQRCLPSTSSPRLRAPPAGQSKLCNLLFVRELHRQLGDSPVAAVACHPGVIDTELGVRMEVGAVGAW